MRKILIAALVIAVIGAVVLLYMQGQKPEKQILGEWTGSYEIGSFDFKDDGTVSIGLGSLSALGEYDIDSETSVISITYSALGLSYTKRYDYVLDKDMLTLTDQTFTNIKMIYSRVSE